MGHINFPPGMLWALRVCEAWYGLKDRVKRLLGKPAAVQLPASLRRVQWQEQPSGKLLELFWDGNKHWRADYAGRSREYVHPRDWQNGDPLNIPPEYYVMLHNAQQMMWQLVEEVETAK